MRSQGPGWKPASLVGSIQPCPSPPGVPLCAHVSTTGRKPAPWALLPLPKKMECLNRLPKSFPFVCNLITSQRLAHVGFHLHSQARLGRREATAGASISHLVRWRASGPRSGRDLWSQVFSLLLQYSSFLLHGGLSYGRSRGGDKGENVKDRGLAEESRWRKKTKWVSVTEAGLSQSIYSRVFPFSPVISR